MNEYTQGSSYYEEFTIEDDEQGLWDAKDAQEVIFTFADKNDCEYNPIFSKKYPSDVDFDEETKVFTVHLTREDTLQLDRSVYIQALMRTLTGETKQTNIDYRMVKPTLYKEAL